jgi:hypothetical protein
MSQTSGRSNLELSTVDRRVGILAFEKVNYKGERTRYLHTARGASSGARPKPRNLRTHGRGKHLPHDFRPL